MARSKPKEIARAHRPRKIKVEPSSDRQPNEDSKYQHCWVEVVRVDALCGSDPEELVGGPAEGPFRVILYLRTIAQGLALVSGRLEVNSEDMEIIRHIAFSSLPSTRREILRAVLTSGGRLNSTSAEAILGVARPTARSRMKELAATGIVSMTASKGKEPDYVTLTGKWSWLLPVRDEDIDDNTEDDLGSESNFPVLAGHYAVEARSVLAENKT